MLDIKNTALIIVDIQGNLAHLMHQKETLFENLQKIVKGAKILNIPIIWMEQLPNKLGRTIPELSSLLQDIKPIEKASFSCCDNKEFIDILIKTDRHQLIIAGIEAHICIYQTACDLLKRGYQVHAVSDAISSRVFENKNIALGRIKDAGGIMTSVEMALFELLKTAKHEKFSDIIKIVK